MTLLSLCLCHCCPYCFTVTFPLSVRLLVLCHMHAGTWRCKSILPDCSWVCCHCHLRGMSTTSFRNKQTDTCSRYYSLFFRVTRRITVLPTLLDFFFLKCLNRWGFDRWRWLIQQVHSVPCQPVTDPVQAQPGLRSSAKDFQCDLGKSLNLLELIFPNCRGDMMFYLWVRAFHTNLERMCSFFLLSTLDFSAERHCWSFNPFPSSLFLLVSLFLRARWLQHKISDCATSNVVVSGWKLPFTHLSVLVFPAGGGTPILSVQVCSLKSWSATKKTNVRCSNARNWLRSISAALVQLRR